MLDGVARLAAKKTMRVRGVTWRCIQWALVGGEGQCMVPEGAFVAELEGAPHRHENLAVRGNAVQ